MLVIPNGLFVKIISFYLHTLYLHVYSLPLSLLLPLACLGNFPDLFGMLMSVTPSHHLPSFFKMQGWQGTAAILDGCSNFYKSIKTESSFLQDTAGGGEASLHYVLTNSVSSNLPTGGCCLA